MLYKESILIQRIFNLYQNYKFLNGDEVEGFDLLKKLDKFSKKYKRIDNVLFYFLFFNLFIMIFLLIIIQDSRPIWCLFILFLSVLYFWFGHNYSYIHSQSFREFYHCIKALKDIPEVIHTDLSSIDNFICEYDYINSCGKNKVGEERMNSNKDGFVKLYKYLGFILIALFLFLYIYSISISNANLNLIMFTLLVSTFLHYNITLLNLKAKETIYEFLDLQIKNYNKNKEILIEISNNTSLFNVYYKYIIMLLNIYRTIIEFNDLNIEYIEYIKKEYADDINNEISKITKTNLKEILYYDFNDMISFITKNKDDNALYIILEENISLLYEKLNMIAPNTKIDVESYGFSKYKL